jgi:hypothetical protein
MATRRLAGLGLGLVGLLVLVSLATRGPRPLGTGGAHERVGPRFFDYAFTSVVIAAAAGLVVVLVAVHALGRRGLPGTAPRRRAWWQNVAVLCAAVLLLALATRVHLLPHFANPAGSGARPGKSAQLRRDVPKGGGRDVRFEWVEAAIAGGVALTVVASLLVARRIRRRAEPSPDDPLAPAAKDVSALLDDALHDLRAERDPRRAVIAAYARMELALGSHGLPRRRSEAPLEYLERALVRLRASAGAVRRLTALFEWAKFSHHDVDAAMRDEAVEALVRVRDELRTGR